MNSLKFPKFAVRYTDDHGDSNEQCSKCKHSITRTICDIVMGKINPLGWCNKFERD
jgi:hypothetical protein